MQRPTAISILGYLNLVFAVFALFGAFGGLQLQFSADPSKNQIAKLMHDNPAYATWVSWTIPLDLLAFVLPLVSGIGLLRLSKWARSLSIAYGIYAILFDIAAAFANYVANATPINSGSTAPPLIAGLIAATMGAVFGLIYPVALIVYMLRPEIIAAFRPPADPSAPPSA